MPSVSPLPNGWRLTPHPDPRLPTVGVDIANKEGIYQIARDLAEQGMAVLMICDEIPEAYYNSHRVLVMRRGRLVAEFNPHQCREEEIAEVVEVINE